MSGAIEPFVKTAPAASLEMFEAEAEGLAELAATGAIRVPEVYDCGVRDGHAFIEMERLLLQSAEQRHEARLGEQLAALHAHHAEQFGWHRDNTIGPTPQINERSNDWIDFFRTQRLEFQLQLAARNGYSGELQDLGAKLAAGIAALFAGYEPDASLLHGDLWAGNWGVAGDVPVIFDPAVYFGDRESDIAMTRLFGGFGTAFYTAYSSCLPMVDGSAERLELYALYHVLNHLNLFGTGYLGQALTMLRRLSRIVAH